MLSDYLEELEKKCVNIDELKIYTPLTQFLKQFFSVELESFENGKESKRPTVRGSYD